MKKTIIHKETYESPLCREYVLATQGRMLQTSSPSGENPGATGGPFTPTPDE